MGDDPPRHSWRAYLSSVGYRYGALHRRIRRALLEADPRCRECGQPGSHADHKTPLCLGGETKIENMQILCVRCSRSKTAREANHMRWKVHKPKKSGGRK